MALVDIIIKNIDAKFEQTHDIKEANLVIYTAKENKYNEVVLISSSISSYLVGYCLDQQNRLKEVSNRTVNIRGTSFNSVVMYKKKKEYDSLPWERDKPEFDKLFNYFKQ